MTTTTKTKDSCRDRHSLHSLVRTDMRWAEVPRIRTISADAARDGGKDRDLDATDR